MMPVLLLAAALAGVPSVSSAAVAPPFAPTFRHYGVLDGLPSDATYTVVQDHSGYVWIGTRDGLARFDGNGFRIFRHDAHDPDSIAANDVSALLVDAQGRVWAGGEGNGLNLYRGDGGGFSHWRHDPEDSRSLAGNDVMAMAQDSDGAIWVGVYAGGVNHLLADGHSFGHVRHRKDDPDGLLSDNVTALAAGTNGALWIGTDAGLQRRDRRGHLTGIVLPADSTAVSVWQLNRYGDGVDAATDAGVFHVDANGRARRIGAAAVAYASLRDAHGGLWIARRDGVDFCAADGSARHYAPHAGVPGSLPGVLSLGMLADHEGGTWLAMLDGGLAYLPPQWSTFDAWRHDPSDSGSLDDDRVRALAIAPDGAIWVAGNNGMLDRVDSRNGSVRHFSGEIALQKSPLDAVAVDMHGRLWIGHRYGLRLDDRGKLHDLPVSTRGTHAVHLVAAARDGTIYFSVIGNGVASVNPDTLAVTPLQPPMPGSAAQQVQELREGADRTIWSASLAGLSRLEPGSERFRFVPGVTRGPVEAFAFAPDGSLWVARNDSLQHYRLSAARARLLESVDSAHGWPAVEVGGLTIDSHGRVFATTLRGLVAYDPASQRVHTYDAADGMGNPEFMPHSLRTENGVLYAGSLGGVIGIRAAALHASTMPPQLAPVTLSVRRDGHMSQLDPRRPISLHWNDSELTVTAHALSFVDPQRNRYRFLLGGFDPDWVDTGTRDTREFSSLGAGNYRLQVRAANGDGGWSAASAPVLLHVAAPPWATPWARALYALAALLLLAFAWVAMRRRLEQRHRFALAAQRQQLAEQASAAKTRFLAGMAHEIRTPMTGVLGMTELLLGTGLDERQRGYADGIRRSGALLLRQVDDALDLARIEAGKLQLNGAPFDPAALLREIVALEQGLAKQKGLSLQVEIEPDASHTLTGDSLRVQQVLLNLTHNALKFTRTGFVRLRLARAEEGVIFSVIDSGPGMSDEECARVFERFEQTEYGRRERGTGLGLSICRELVALMGGKISVHSEPGEGCAFDVHLPLREASDAADRPVVTSPPPCTSGRSLRLLVVEDDPIAAEVLAGLLRAQGHAATHAPDALAALTEMDASAQPFDALLSDLDLPGMDGRTLAKLLRERGYAEPIIAVTASSRGDEEQRVIDAGMDALLRKPVLPESLREVLKKVSGERTASALLR
ncbi:MAG TPA: ATP-binding protein [Rhodanobacteraceae bacterium]